ncbi:adenosylmethionine-8-amino-7-oxononanoate aminotransferase [Breoghania corrubedonensis]|uniref:Adenosylmethionine-8-amino-7-oxononanoate aminotransferase n=1 Tax=Breoghania corrubedonensis TaxID=665038 RepID=A0A2T5VA31_9HYPH|nr:aspartate aminotransferase family protein [Breoghania corrubedonensis]PTW60615.1 adenosylmethionine-8-amino-7-oxononanoate aminotransferase [Breoghania corrubedonensis]
MSATIYKKLNDTPLRLTGGDRVWLHADGRAPILDTCGGVVVSSLGHRHPRIRAAMAREAENVAWAHAGSFTCDAAEELAELLIGEAGPGLSHVQFLSGGSEAMELAVKVAYQYHCERGEPSRKRFISRRQSYHGSTLGTLALSHNPARRGVFEPLLAKTSFVSACNAYRGQKAGENDAAYVARLARELDDRITSLGSDTVAAFVAEPVVGSTNGAVPAVPGYFKAIREVCNRHGVLLILDDVMSGMGRTGHLYSHFEDGVVPDIVAIGKGLAAGYQPISGYLVAPHIHEALRAGSGILQNGQTHVNHPFACAVALEVQKTIRDDGLIAAVRRQGARLRAGLEAIARNHPFIGDVRGRGLFLGIEFVADKKTRVPLAEGAAIAALLKRTGFDNGLLLYPGSGTADGREGCHILFGPPFIASDDEIDVLLARFGKVLDTVLADMRRVAAVSQTVAEPVA